MGSQAADMGFVDDRVAPGMARWPVVAPVEALVGDEATARPVRTRRHGARKGVEQRPGGVEAMALRGREGALRAQGIGRAMRQADEARMPDIACAVPIGVERHGGGQRAVRAVEQEQGQAGRVAAEDRQVEAVAGLAQPQGQRLAGLDPHRTQRAGQAGVPE